MKKLTLALCLLTLPALAGTYSITTSVSQDSKLDKARVRANKAVCQYYGLQNTCTQTQAREQFCKRANFGGVTACSPDPTSTPENPKPQICVTSPLVSNCAGATQVNIFATATEFAQDHFAGWIKTELGPKNDAEDKASARTAWPTMTQADRDAVCGKIGLLPGCDPW